MIAGACNKLDCSDLYRLLESQVPAAVKSKIREVTEGVSDEYAAALRFLTQKY